MYRPIAQFVFATRGRAKRLDGARRSPPAEPSVRSATRLGGDPAPGPHFVRRGAGQAASPYPRHPWRASRTLLATAMWCAGMVASGGADEGLEVRQRDDIVTVHVGDRPCMTYRQSPNPNKVYVAELYSPSGVQVLLDAPPDHVHHHGLMYVQDAGPFVFWMDGEGTQRPRGPTRITTRAESPGWATATLEQVLDWTAPDGQKVLEEQRRVCVHDGNDFSATLLSWDSTLTAPRERGPVHLSTPRSYAGLGFRFPKSMDGKASFMFPDGSDTTPVRNTEKVTRDTWCACTGPVDGKTVTVAMFSHPRNARHPAYWFTMSDSLTYLSGTLNLYRQPIWLPAARSLQLVYGVAVWDGEVDPDTVEGLYQQWIALAPTPAAWDAWADTHVNVARPEHGTTASASSAYGPDYEATKVIDGTWAVRETDKWNSAQNITPHYLRLDLGQVRTIDRIRLYHEGILPDGTPFTTADYRLQKSVRPWGPWEDLVPPVRDNTDGMTEHPFAPTETRYLRLLIETGEQQDGNAYGRIFEWEVYSPRAAEPPRSQF